MRLAIADGLVEVGGSVMDYGCGRGDDVRRLSACGYDCVGWDPEHAPTGERRASPVVNLGYVLNVIEDKRERIEVLNSAWDLTIDVLVVAARLVNEFERLSAPDEMADGYRTNMNTFQKFYGQDELRRFLAEALGTPPVAAAPGIFYVFRSTARANAFLADRFRSRPFREPSPARRRIEADPRLTKVMIERMEQLARTPEPEELPFPQEMLKEFGSLRGAARSAIEGIGEARWSALRRARQDDLTVYLALARFDGRPAFNQLGSSLRLDVRSQFGSYAEACRVADEALLALGRREAIEEAIAAADCGKLLPTAFYVHVSALDALPTTLRLYEGCARALVGSVDGANVIKLGRMERTVSYLAYPDFFTDPHPTLAHSTRVDLRTFDVRTRTFAGSGNPPILHRKEAFLEARHPSYAKFARLTRSEERAGLFEEPSTIGTMRGWQSALTSRGRRLSGHRLVLDRQAT